MPPIIKTRVKTSEKGDPLFKKLARDMRGVGGQYVSIGILDPERMHPDSDATLGQIALWQEFGTHTATGKPIIPARSFLRTPVDTGMAGIERLKTRLLRQVMNGQLSVRKGLEAIGADIVRRMQNAITKRIDPALAPLTLHLRRERGIKGTVPLIATRFLYNAIHFAVRDGFAGKGSK